MRIAIVALSIILWFGPGCGGVGAGVRPPSARIDERKAVAVATQYLSNLYGPRFTRFYKLMVVRRSSDEEWWSLRFWDEMVEGHSFSTLVNRNSGEVRVVSQPWPLEWHTGR